MPRLTCLPLALGLVGLTPFVVRANPVPAESAQSDCVNCVTVATAPVPSVMQRSAAPAAAPVQQIAKSSVPSDNEVVDSSVYQRQTLVGKVQSVQGDKIFLTLDSGSIREVKLPDAAGSDFSRLVGQRVVLTDVNCRPPQPPIARIPTPETIIPQKW